MSTLYEITDDLLALDALLDEVGGDITDERAAAAVDEWMADLQANLDRKIDGYCSLIQNIDALANAASAEAKRLADLARVRSNKVNGLKDRLKFALETLRMKKVQTARFQVSVCGNGGLAPLDIHGPVPEHYIKHIPQVDNDSIRADLESGKSLDFAVLMNRGTHLRIK